MMLWAESDGATRANCSPDLTSDRIAQYIQGRVGEADLKLWAKKLSWVLLPGPVAVFARHCWCASFGPVGEYALDNLLVRAVHNLLVRAGVLGSGWKRLRVHRFLGLLLAHCLRLGVCLLPMRSKLRPRPPRLMQLQLWRAMLQMTEMATSRRSPRWQQISSLSRRLWLQIRRSSSGTST